MDFINKIFNGDCLEEMKKIPDNSIAACITDPPYNYEFIGRKWDAEEIKRRTERVKDSNTLVKNIPYGSGLAGGVRNARWYKKNRDNIVEYQKWVEDWGRELYRILKPGALVFTFNSTRTIAHVQVGLENVGFYARDIIVWRRHSGIPKGLNVAKKLEKLGDSNASNWVGWHSALRNEWEAISVVQKPLVNNYIETLQKYNVSLFKTKQTEDDSFQSNIIENIKRDKIDEENIHVTVKPIDLIKKLIDLSVPKSADNIVIDPFMGSGTTALAATLLGINWVGVEIVPDYVDIAYKRLKKQKTELDAQISLDLF
ncbi:DNA-methyltransferase [Bacillus pumilus]|uniref:DNA-methyltransferase n=1 Tax=Bacillus pumilus TaxID=1408 RepID=UPI001C241E39|nr:site-specific DNA-methyltransferase [Bacillus pumilus]MBU8726905.1 site-specific DNA-methyltransferase [Bacillus pumilus]